MLRGVQIVLYSILCIIFYVIIRILWCTSWTETEFNDQTALLFGLYLSFTYLHYTCNYFKDRKWLKSQFFRIAQYQGIKKLGKSMAHAIRNPLTVTSGFLQLMKQKKLQMEQKHLYCDYAESGIKEVDEVITNYLHSVELEINTPHRLHVQAELDQKIKPLLDPLCVQTKIELIFCHLTKEALYIHGQSEVFCQSVVDIMMNAIEAMPAGGRLEVTTWLDYKEVYVHIKDTGVGMNRKKISQIGAPFWDRQTKGTGFGLMRVLNLLKAMNGTISYYSSPQKGTACLLQYKQV